MTQNQIFPDFQFKVLKTVVTGQFMLSLNV
jgi:hypothetical protein